MVSLSQAGSTASNVYRFVRGYYETNGLTYLLLVGDSGQMPALLGTKGYMAGDPTDLRYVLLDGDDMYPDAVVSRFPGATLGDVSNMVWRSIAYEKNPSPDAAWYHKGAGAAGNTYLGGGFYDYSLTAELRTILMGSTYTEVDQICPTNGIDASMISAFLNDGRGIVNFIGHGDSVSWNWSGALHAPNFNTGHVFALTNTAALPFVIIAGCDGGRYTVGTCLAESFLKAGAAGRPIGAVAVQAAFDEELADPSWVAQEETVTQLTSNSLHGVGPLCFSGVIKALDVCTNASPPGTTGEEFAEMKHLFGDGSLMLYTATPTAMNVSHDGVAAVWQGAYDVSAAGVSGALCALYDAATHTLHGAVFADTNGYARIRLPTLSLTNSLTLTVTAFNRIPFVDTVLVSAAPPPGIVLQIR
jgi:hypothetical protein